MKITEFIKKELQGWKTVEITGLIFVLVIIIVNTLVLKDSPAAIINAICGILYTIIAGKGKISCYFFGLIGSWSYIYLSFTNALWGNMLLYFLYYIPMQILGIFRWKKHLKQDSCEIIKISLDFKQRLKLATIGVLGCIISIGILNYFNDKSPVIDGITTFLSILGMYLTVKRAIEQWIIWMIVNGLSLIMWLNLIMQGTKAYSTVLMWGVYFILAIYFYRQWKKELETVIIQKTK